MNFDSRLYEFEFVWRNGSRQKRAVQNGHGRVHALKPRVDVWRVVLLIVEEIHRDDDAVKHADRWQDKLSKSTFR